MATIDKRGSTWRVRVRRRGYPVQAATFDTRRQAGDWAKAVEGDMARGRFLDTKEAERTTLGEALERYGREVTPRKRGHSQKERYIAAALKKHALALRPLAQVRGADMAALIRDLERRGLGPARIRLHLALLSHLYTTARREWGMEGLANPVHNVTKPKPAPARERRLQPGEEEKLLAAAPPILAAAIRVSLETAIRQGELMRLRWEHVDMDRRTARLLETKTEPRTVPLSPRAVEVLRGLPRRLDGYVFPWRASVSPSPAFRRLCQRVGIADLHWHDLRHEATSRFFERGLSIEKVAAITGHRTWAMLKRYTHPRAEDIARELAAKA